MTKAELMRRLTAAGYPSVANYVQHQYLPGFTHVSVKEILGYCRMKDLRSAGEIIEMFLESNDEDV